MWPKRRAEATTRGASAASRRIKATEDDDRTLLLAMGKQMKELHASLPGVFDAWKNRSCETRPSFDKPHRTSDGEQELRSIKDELQTVRATYKR
ncbi:LOW QUALITY PROTEIN: hypothetical protein ColTof3_14894 [Colletotrichum tofieldiae]|nr:LOW QUALITY PROTEIN: hypothetical protein ColTof3_14894 [Colletotrichum tofieldiae]